MPLELDYYYGSEADQYSFYRIPKLLFTDSRFKGVCVEAKVLYGLLLDRMGLSIRNGWLDAEGRVYIIFTISDVMATLGCGEQKAGKLMRELDCAKGIGLIERRRRGLGRPDLIYVKNFTTGMGAWAGMRGRQPNSHGCRGSADAVDNVDNVDKVDSQAGAGRAECPEPWGSLPQNHEKHGSRTMKTSTQEPWEPLPNDTDINNTGYSDTGLNDTCNSFSGLSNPSIHPEADREGRIGRMGWMPAGMESGAVDNGKGHRDDASRDSPGRMAGQCAGNGHAASSAAGMGHAASGQGSAGSCSVEKMDAYRCLIRENIGYDALVHDSPGDRERLDGLVELMAEVCSSSRGTVRINREEMCAESVKSRFLKLGMGHIQYVMHCMDKNTTPVSNIRAYTLSALFNAPVTMGQYYSSLVRHDMASG